MNRIIKAMEEKYVTKALDMIRRTFTNSESAEDAQIVVNITEHISKELIEYGFDRARELGFEAVLVEGNPQNYQKRGFKTSADYGITAGESVGLPAPECLMVKELKKNALEKISGVLEYTDYKTIL